MIRLVWCAAALALSGGRVVAQMVVDPTIDVTPARHSATVGDSIPLRIRVRLDDRDLLLDSVPRLATQASRGMRVLVADRVVRQSDGTFVGKVVVAFYRTGRRVIPPFLLTYRRNLNVLGAPVRSDSTVVDILPLLPGGSGQPLKDIKDLAPLAGDDLVQMGAALLAVLFGIGATVWWRRSRRRRFASAPLRPVPEPIAAPGALQAALERLRGIEQEGWPARGEVTRHYEAVVAVMRDYLAESVRIPARASTTAEIVAAIPARFTSNGTRARLQGLLHEADLVKFARANPGSADAARFLGGVRELLAGWATDAVR